MNEKITLPTIIQLLAIRTGDTRKQSEDFIRELLAAVSEALSEGEQVKIKDFGVFKTIAVDARKSVNVSTGGEHTIPAHRKVVFVPSREIAALINAPFAMFETVELGDDVEFEAEPQVPESLEPVDFEQEVPEPESEMSEPDTELAEPEPEMPGPGVGSDMEEVIETDDEAESGVVYEIVSETDYGEPEELPSAEESSEVEENQTEQESDEDESDLNTEPMALYGPETVGEDEDVDDNIEDDDDDQDDEDDHDDEDEYEEEEPSSHRFLYGFLSGFATAAVVAFAVFFCAYYFEWDKAAGFGKAAPDDIIDTIAAPEPEPAMAVATSVVESASTTAENATTTAETTDAQEAAPTQPSDQKQYDTITKTRYLTTMAKDHYGNFNLWPYIYKENEAFLGHPDRIRPGTQVVIPPLSKYGVDPSNPVDIAKAKRLGVEIYSRYK